MQPNDKADLTEIVSQVLAYYRQPVSEFTLSVWWSACQPYSLEQIRKAILDLQAEIAAENAAASGAPRFGGLGYAVANLSGEP